MTKRLLTVGLTAVGLTVFVMASQWGYAAQPPAYAVPATPEMMQSRARRALANMIKAQLAAERNWYAEQRTAITPSGAGTGSTSRGQSSARGRSS